MKKLKKFEPRIRNYKRLYEWLEYQDDKEQITDDIKNLLQKLPNVRIIRLFEVPSRYLKEEDQRYRYSAKVEFICPFCKEKKYRVINLYTELLKENQRLVCQDCLENLRH
ncbi:hypothetical protein J7L36_01355 [bacterium]|nr:hypothetical protein [bacterium]